MILQFVYTKGYCSELVGKMTDDDMWCQAEVAVSKSGGFAVMQVVVLHHLIKFT